MSRKRIGKSSDFAAVLQDVLKDVETNVQQTTDDVARTVADDVARDINRQVDEHGWRSLKDTWKVAIDFRSPSGTSRVRINKVYVVHAENYRLPHLLEKGHVLWQNREKKTHDHPTIKPAEQRGIVEFQTKLKAAVQTNIQKVDTSGTIEVGGTK